MADIKEILPYFHFFQLNVHSNIIGQWIELYKAIKRVLHFHIITS
jgi:hypothetical protein